MTGPRPSVPSSPPGAAGEAHAAWRMRRARRGGLFVLMACLAVCLAAASPASCAEPPPAVTGVAIGQVGVFTSAPPQEATPKGSRYRLSREGPDVAAEPGVRFGVVFEVQGKPTGGPVVIEAGLVPPGDAAVAQRWFVPAVVGEKAQAVASFVYGWEAAPGPWRLTLSEDGRVLAEQTFHLGGGPRTSADHAAAPPSLSAPAPAPAQTLVTAREAPSMTSGSPAAAAPATPAVPEHPAEAGQAAVSGQAVAPASAGPPPAAPGTAPGGHASPAAASPVTDSPPVAPGIPETAESAEPSRSPGKNPEMVPAQASDKGKKAVSPEQGLKAPEKAPEKAPAKETAKERAKETARETARETTKTPAKETAKETAKANGTLYLLQTGLFSVRDNAAAEAARYRAKGYPGCVLEEGAGSRRRYRVIVGRFPDQGRATEARRSFVAREGAAVMVKEVPAAEVSRRLNCR